MNKLQESIKLAAKAIISKMVSGDAREWPPTCVFIAYQPVRPEAGIEAQTDSKTQAQSNL